MGVVHGERRQDPQIGGNDSSGTGRASRRWIAGLATAGTAVVLLAGCSGLSDDAVGTGQPGGTGRVQPAYR